MDRRQQKTRTAIFKAFGVLLEHKNYNNITVQEIIDGANIGRSTFYAHFETKDDLLKELCHELFGHIINSAVDWTPAHGVYFDKNAADSVFCQLLQHLEVNDKNVLGLLSCESSDIFFAIFQRLFERIDKGSVCQSRPPQKHHAARRFFSQSYLQQLCGNGLMVD